MSVCLFGWVGVLYINPNLWTDCDEIWHGGGPQGREGSWLGVGVDLVPPPPGHGVLLEPQLWVLAKTL